MKVINNQGRIAFNQALVRRVADSRIEIYREFFKKVYKCSYGSFPPPDIVDKFVKRIIDNKDVSPAKRYSQDAIVKATIDFLNELPG